MLVIAAVTDEIIHFLPRFGLRVTHVQAACLAGLYVGWRPYYSVDTQATYMEMVPDLKWLPGDSKATKIEVMQSLIRHLDQLYFVPTFEHDCQPAE